MRAIEDHADVALVSCAGLWAGIGTMALVLPVVQSPPLVFGIATLAAMSVASLAWEIKKWIKRYVDRRLGNVSPEEG